MLAQHRVFYSRAITEKLLRAEVAKVVDQSASIRYHGVMADDEPWAQWSL
jgi:hypothetical protein